MSKKTWKSDIGLWYHPWEQGPYPHPKRVLFEGDSCPAEAFPIHVIPFEFVASGHFSAVVFLLLTSKTHYSAIDITILYKKPL